MNLRSIILLLLFSKISFCIGQEFNLNITINSNRVNSVDQQVIQDLQSKINDFINTKTWSNNRFENYEKIAGSIVLNLSSFDGISTYNAELNININRPVYNSSYTTTLFNMRDRNFEFSFLPGQTLNYSEISSNDNLVATITFYLYTILGIDADSFALNGGKAYFQKATKIVNEQQMTSSKGWDNYSGQSRGNLILDLTNNKLSNFHSLWYDYHRGLDEMSNNTNRGKIKVITTLDKLEEIAKIKNNSILLALFGDSKLNEFLQICAIEDSSERKTLKERLIKLYPGKKIIIEKALEKQ